MKKHIIFIFLMLIVTATINSQNFDEKLQRLAKEVTLKLSSKKVGTIAVYPFFNIKKKQTDLSLFTSSEFSGYVANNNLKTVDRDFIEQTLQEHELNSDGLIDPATAKKFGMLIAVDAFITGTVDKFGSVIRIKIKAINPETGEVYASVFDNLPIDYDMSEFLGLDNWKENREKAEENKSQNPNCAKENVGDYCFFNNTNASYEIHLKSDLGGGFSSTYNKLIISPKMKACFKDLKMGSYSYEAKKKIGMVGPATKYSTEFKGDFTVKECESRLQNIENGSFKPNERIINSTNETELFSIEIINPNYYSRQLSFINSSNQTESVTVGSKSKTSIKLPKGFYRFLSNTTYTNVTVQQSNFTLKNNKSILLIEDHKN